MSNPDNRTKKDVGPEGVPLDAPDNDAPAISPHAVSRTHRAEEDAEALEHSRDFRDERSVAHEDGEQEPSPSEASPRRAKRR